MAGRDRARATVGPGRSPAGVRGGIGAGTGLRPFHFCVLAAFAASAVYAGQQIRREYAVVKGLRIVDSARIVGPDGIRGDWPAAAIGDPAATPRLLLASALLHASRAASAPSSTERSGLLHRAERETAAFAAARPYWGEAEVVQAYVASQSPDRLEQAVAAYGRSYASSPFLRQAAVWRVEFGIAHWARLDAATRAAMVNEAVWLFRLQPDQRVRLTDIARDTDAYVPILLQWRHVRLRDKDYLRAP